MTRFATFCLVAVILTGLEAQAGDIVGTVKLTSPVKERAVGKKKIRPSKDWGADYDKDAEVPKGVNENEYTVVEVLGEGLQAAHVVVGYDFVFGAKRRGNAALLGDLGASYGFGVTSLAPAATEAGEVFSSTKIRAHLREGRPLAAGILLGRPWEIEGRVEHGEALGRQLGYPTANVGLGEYLLPAQGIYAVKAGIDEGRGTVWRDGVASLGTRPTVGGTRLQLEVHLFDFAADLYGRHLRVALIDYLRPEKKFDGLAALTAQIAEDCRQARQVLAAYAGPAPGSVPRLMSRPVPVAAPGGVYERALGPRRS